MAGLNMFPILVVFLSASPFGMVFAFSTMDECSQHFTEKCGYEVGDSVFEGSPVSDACCRRLVSLGKTCQDLFVANALDSLSNAEKPQFLANSAKVWNRCVAVALSPSSSIYPVKVSNQKALDNCRIHFSKNCALELVNHISKGETVSDNCCRHIVHAKKPCHQLFLDWSLGYQPNVDRSRVFEKSNKIWNRCVAITVSPSLSAPTIEN